MNEVLEVFVSNAITVLSAYAMFVCAVLADILFSLQFNIRHIGQTFCVSILVDGILKALSLVLGTLLLVLLIDLFTPLIGMNKESADFLNIASLLSTIGRGTLYYVRKAYKTFQNIMKVPTIVSKENNFHKLLK